MVSLIAQTTAPITARLATFEILTVMPAYSIMQGTSAYSSLCSALCLFFELCYLSNLVFDDCPGKTP